MAQCVYDGPGNGRMTYNSSQQVPNTSCKFSHFVLLKKLAKPKLLDIYGGLFGQVGIWLLFHTEHSNHAVCGHKGPIVAGLVTQAVFYGGHFHYGQFVKWFPLFCFHVEYQCYEEYFYHCWVTVVVPQPEEFTQFWVRE